MATNTVIITICDACKKSTEDITSYEIRKDGSTKRTKVDLCGTDSVVLENLIAQAPKATPGRKRATRITSVEEIERMKQQERRPAKKAAAKKTAAAK